MRPRSCDRGDGRNSRQALPPCIPASMRPRSCDRGDDALGRGGEVQHVASMRPRSCDRGDAARSKIWMRRALRGCGRVMLPDRGVQEDRHGVPRAVSLDLPKTASGARQSATTQPLDYSYTMWARGVATKGLPSDSILWSRSWWAWPRSTMRIWSCCSWTCCCSDARN